MKFYDPPKDICLKSVVALCRWQFRIRNIYLLWTFKKFKRNIHHLQEIYNTSAWDTALAKSRLSKNASSSCNQPGFSPFFSLPEIN